MNQLIKDIQDTFDCDERTARQIYELNERQINEMLDKRLEEDFEPPF